MEINDQKVGKSDCDKTVKINGYGEIRYLSKKALKRKHPDGNYSIIGAIGAGLVNPGGQFDYEGETRFYYHPKQSSLWYHTLGYLEIQDGEYFSVVKKNKRIWIFFLIAFLVVLGAVLLRFEKQQDESWLEEGAMDYELSQNWDTQPKTDTIGIPGFAQVRMEAGTDKAYVVLWNPETNPCYFRYTIKDEAGEMLYQSGLIPPGKAVTEIQLSRAFPRGTYPISIEIHTFSLDDHETPLNGGVVECKLVSIEP